MIIYWWLDISGDICYIYIDITDRRFSEQFPASLPRLQIDLDGVVRCHGCPLVAWCNPKGNQQKTWGIERTKKITKDQFNILLELSVDSREPKLLTGHRESWPLVDVFPASLSVFGSCAEKSFGFLHWHFRSQRLCINKLRRYPQQRRRA